MSRTFTVKTYTVQEANAKLAELKEKYPHRSFIKEQLVSEFIPSKKIDTVKRLFGQDLYVGKRKIEYVIKEVITYCGEKDFYTDNRGNLRHTGSYSVFMMLYTEE